MKIENLCKVAFVILVCTSGSAAVRAQLSVPYVVASFLFDSDTEKVVENDIAVTDNVEIIYEGDWDFGSGYFMIPTAASLTFKAEEFQNICVIQLQTYHYDDAGDYPVKCTIVDAKGRGITGVSDLTTGLAQSDSKGKIHISGYDEDADIYTFNFGDNTVLSEVTLRFSADLYIYMASVSLNVDPVVSDQDLKLYADDIVPFEKKTNMSSVYQYYLSTNKDLADDDLEDRFRDVPDAGISLAGKADGQYAFYLRTNPDITTNQPIHRMIVNYSATPPSTEIDSLTTSSTNEYYDLNGRRIKTPTKGLNIIKNPITGQTSKVFRK